MSAALLPRVTVIVARDRRGGIGRGNALPWHLPEDLQHFKASTLGHPIVMGRKTFESIGRALPGRRNLVLSRNAGWSHPGVERIDDLAAARVLCAGEPELFVIGGGELYAQALPIADRLLITEVDLDADADTFFPTVDPALWQQSTLSPAVSRTGTRYVIGEWVRRPPEP